MTSYNISHISYYDDAFDNTSFTTILFPTGEAYVNQIGNLFNWQCTLGPLDAANLVFPDFATAENYLYNTYGNAVAFQIDVVQGTSGSTMGALYDNMYDGTINALNLKVDQATTVNGHALTGNVTITKSDVGLGNVDNTSDANKPISTATQTALNGKFSTPTGTTSQVVLGNGTLGTLPITTRTTSTLSLSLVGTGATGTQISSTKDSTVRLTVSTSATATIAGAATSTVALKICSTNNSTEASWTTVATSETSQSYSLAIALQGVTGMKEQLCADIPAGWYVKLVNSGSGTHSESFVSGQQTIYG